MTLYELTNDLLTLQAEQENADIDDQVFRDTLEGLDGAFEDKCDGWAKWIRGMENDIKGMKEEESRLKLRRQRLETAVAKAKSTLSDYMRIVGKTKFKTALFNFGFRKSTHVVVLDATKAPEWALVQQVPKISLTAIKEHIDKGEDLNWAEVVETESLQIK